MAYAVGLTRPEIFTGIIAQSGYVINQKIFNYKWNESSKINFLHTHGELDMVVPFSKATETKIFSKKKLRLNLNLTEWDTKFPKSASAMFRFG